MNMPKSTKLDRAAAARLIRPHDSVLAGFAAEEKQLEPMTIAATLTYGNISG